MASIREELRRIYDTNGGQLTPEAVVKAAKPAKSPLHGSFEWNDQVAGHKYRLGQAAELIRSQRIEYVRDRRGPRTIREYTSTYEVGAASTGVYRATEEVMSDELSAAIVLRNMERAMADMKRQYGHLREFWKLLQRMAG